MDSDHQLSSSVNVNCSANGDCFEQLYDDPRSVPMIFVLAFVCFFIVFLFLAICQPQNDPEIESPQPPVTSGNRLRRHHQQLNRHPLNPHHRNPVAVWEQAYGGRRNQEELATTVQQPHQHLNTALPPNQRQPLAPSRDVVIEIPAGEGDNECVICLSEGTGSTQSLPCMWRVLPLCRHKFHSDCITMWLAVKRSCPICRTRV